MILSFRSKYLNVSDVVGLRVAISRRRGCYGKKKNARIVGGAIDFCPVKINVTSPINTNHPHPKATSPSWITSFASQCFSTNQGGLPNHITVGIFSLYLYIVTPRLWLSGLLPPHAPTSWDRVVNGPTTTARKTWKSRALHPFPSFIACASSIISAYCVTATYLPLQVRQL